MMSQADYLKFAQMLDECDYGCYTIGDLAKKIADVFQYDNPRFDRLKFYLAANVSHDATGELVHQKK